MGEITMGDNFVLSEKRKELRKDILKTENKRDIHFLYSLLDIIEKQDKEFIRLLKEFIKVEIQEERDTIHDVRRVVYLQDLLKKINKLTGGELNDSTRGYRNDPCSSRFGEGLRCSCESWPVDEKGRCANI